MIAEQRRQSVTLLDMIRNPTTDEERTLVALQEDVSRGNLAVIERNALLLSMFSAGYRQNQLSDLLNGATEAVGDLPLTQGAVHKAIKRLRNGEVKASIEGWNDNGSR
mgnify:CR=1 FL=1|tara:strand:+ start:222 stop:545 length:324 start_codon:yes stop_codon:yes gene_type:complete